MILLIGATSFIGVHTVTELLKQGCSVTVTGRNGKFKDYYDSLGVNYINLDITRKEDFNHLPNQGIEAVILLAGLLPANVQVNLEQEENAYDYFDINVLGTINVLEYCRANHIRRVISTCSYADVVNSWRAVPPITEDEPRSYSYTGDHAVYVFSKNAANDVLEYYNAQHDMKNIIFRLPPVYGVGPHGSYCINGKVTKSGIQKFIEKACIGEDIHIFKGDEKYIRDFAYVKDVAHACYLAIKSPNASGLYNMTSGIGVSLADQIGIITEVFAKEKRSRLIYENQESHPHTSFLFSMNKAQRDFNFTPAFSSFKDMMIDFKKDQEEHLYQDLFEY